MKLTDQQHLAAMDAAYAAIEGQGRGGSATENQITLAQILFSPGLEAALATIEPVALEPIRAAAEQLVAALDAVMPELDSQASFMYAHGFRYDGPTFEHELKALRALL